MDQNKSLDEVILVQLLDRHHKGIGHLWDWLLKSSILLILFFVKFHFF